MKKRFIIFLLIILALHKNGAAQDIHFSQYYLSPLTLNPANTGNYNGDLRIVNNYRTQWSSISEPYLTNSLSFDKPVYILKHHFSAGAVYIFDKSGDAQLLVNKFYLSLGYHKNIGKGAVHIGGQLGYVSKSFSTDKLTFPNQFDNQNGHFNTQLPNSESFQSNNLSYLDLNAGISYTATYGKFQPELGVALFHINRPQESFYKNVDDKLPQRLDLHAGLRTEIQNIGYVHPTVLYSNQVKASEIVAALNVGYYLSENKWKAKDVFIGAMFRSGFARNTDAAIATGGITFNHIKTGISYDFTISDLSGANNYRGGLEIAIIYTALDTRPRSLTIPCDRF